MFDVPIDGWYAWLGVAAVSVVVLGLAASLPTEPPPDAARTADAVDRVAASEHAATAEVPFDATTIRIGPTRLALRSDAGTSHAAFAFGPVTPVRGNASLDSVLRGGPPERGFASPAALARAATEARERRPTWRDADGPLRIRKLSWGGVHVTLVGV